MLVKSAEVQCRGPLTKSAIRQPSIRAFMEDLTLTTPNVPQWLQQPLSRSCSSTSRSPGKNYRGGQRHRKKPKTQKNDNQKKESQVPRTGRGVMVQQVASKMWADQGVLQRFLRPVPQQDLQHAGHHRGRKQRAIKKASEAAEVASRCLWIRRGDPRVGSRYLDTSWGLITPGWLTWRRVYDVWKTPNTQWAQVTSLMKCPGCITSCSMWQRKPAHCLFFWWKFLFGSVSFLLGSSVLCFWVINFKSD